MVINLQPSWVEQGRCLSGLGRAPDSLGRLTSSKRQAIYSLKQSGLEVWGLDYQELAKCIWMNMTDFEIRARKLSKIVPVRKFARGSMPGMRGQEAIRGYIPEEEQLFIHSSREPTAEEKVNLYATALECSVRFVFSHTLYRWSNGRKKTCPLETVPRGEHQEKSVRP